MQRPLENIIFDDSFRNIFPAAAFRRYRSAQPTAKRRLSLREILLMSSMGTARKATISIPDATRSPFQAPLQLRDGALREILLMSSMGTVGKATISIPDATRSPFQAPLQLRDGALRETLLMNSMGTVGKATISIPDASRSPFQAPLQLRDGALRETLRDDASRCRGEWKLARTTAGDDAGWDLPRQGQDVVNRGQRRRCARGAKHRPILRNPERGCTTPYHATIH